MSSLFGFALAVAFWPNAASGGLVLRWSLIATIPPLVILLCQQKLKFTIIHLVSLLFLVWCAITTLWTSNIYDGLGVALQLLFLAQVFIVANRIDVKSLTIGLGLGLWISNAVTIIQWAIPGERGAWLDQYIWPRADGYAGLFVNCGTLEWTLALVIVAVLTFRLWWLIPGLLPGLMLNSSRTALLAFGIVGIIWLWGRYRLMIFLVIVASVGASTLVKFNGTIERFNIWLDVVSGFSVLGNGLGSFATSFPEFATRIDTFSYRVQHAHSDLLEFGFETGAIGIIFIVLFFYLLISTNSKYKYIIIAFCVEATVSFPFYLPVTAFIGALFAGCIASDRRSLQCEFNQCREALQRRFATFKGECIKA